MSLRHSQVVELRSSTTAVVAGEMYRSRNARLYVHVVTAPANLVNIQGSSGPNPAEFDALLVEAAGGVVASTNLGPGYYRVIGRPNQVRLTVGIDAGGPRSYRTSIDFDVEE